MARQVYFVGAVGGGITRLAGDSHLDVACGHARTLMAFEGYRPGEHGPLRIEVDDMDGDVRLFETVPVDDTKCRVRGL